MYSFVNSVVESYRVSPGNGDDIQLDQFIEIPLGRAIRTTRELRNEGPTRPKTPVSLLLNFATCSGRPSLWLKEERHRKRHQRIRYPRRT